MKGKFIWLLIIPILFIIPNVLDAQDSAWIDVRFESPVWNVSSEPTITAEVWARANVDILAGSLVLAANRNLITADTCFSGPELNWFFYGYNAFTDSIISTGDTLTYFLLGGGGIPTGDPPVFEANTDVLFGTVEMTFKVDSLSVILNGDVEFWLDSLTLPPALSFILTSPKGLSIYPQFEADTIIITTGEVMCGDANADQEVNIADAVWMVNYIFMGGEPPAPVTAGDVNCDAKISLVDIIYEVNYIFRGGYAPCDPDGDDVPDC